MLFLHIMISNCSKVMLEDEIIEPHAIVCGNEDECISVSLVMVIKTFHSRPWFSIVECCVSGGWLWDLATQLLLFVLEIQWCFHLHVESPEANLDTAAHSWTTNLPYIPIASLSLSCRAAQMRWNFSKEPVRHLECCISFLIALAPRSITLQTNCRYGKRVNSISLNCWMTYLT